MKKILSIFFIFCILLMITYFLFNKKTKENVVVKEEKEEIRAVFISYIDYQDKLKNKTSIEMEEVINNMINNIKNNKFNTIILQVRPFADAIYKSNIYPPSLTVVNKGEELELDILDYFITLSHQNNLKLYAWINPYRLSNTNDKSNILDTASFYDFFNTSKIYEGEDGIYFNPASSEVLNLITNGIKEIVENYSIDGILYDDYFYPNDVIDLQEYDSYKKSHPEVTIEEFRINNINNLIKSTYEAVKSINKNVLFGISPAGNIENNLNNEYLDVKFLLKNKGYLDFIMPQLYYGFNNTNKPFLEVLKEFDNLIENDIKLIPALALYKSGEKDNFAKEGEDEWINNSDIIKKQIIVSRTKNNYYGFSIYRYDYLFNETTNNNLKEEIKGLYQIF